MAPMKQMPTPTDSPAHVASCTAMALSTPRCERCAAWFGPGQAPNRFTPRGAVSGLPNLNEALRQFSGLINGAAGMVVGQAPAAEVARSAASHQPLISPKPSEDDPHPAAEEVPGAL